MNIYQRINEIRKELPYIQKDTTVKGAGAYKAVSHDQVTALARPLFIKHGVVIVPRQVSYTERDSGKTTSSGAPYWMYASVYEIDFINIDDPADKLTAIIGSMAEDTGDKAPGKSCSYSTKYAILKVLMIETGESDESRNPATVEYLSGEGLEIIKEMHHEVVEDPAAFLRAARIGSLDTIPISRQQEILGLLQRKKATLRQPGED